MQTLAIDQADSFTLETSGGKKTATSHRDHFNADIFNDQPSYFTNIKQDKTQKDILLEQTNKVNQALFYKMDKSLRKK